MRHYLIWGGIAALWTAFLALAWFMSRNGNFGMIDFRVYDTAARLLLNGEAIYQGTEGMIYLYPPLVAQVLMPFAARLSTNDLWTLWFTVNVILLVGAVALLSRHLKTRYFLWVLTPLFMPMLEALYIGQVTIILLALFAGAWLAVGNDRHFLAGGLLALAAWIKVFPVLLIVYFLWKRDWRVVRGALISGLVLGLVQIAISGVEPMIAMTQTLFALNESGQAWTLVRNASVFGFTSQLFEAHPQVTPVVVSLALFWISRAGITLALIGGLFYATVRSDNFDREYSLALLTSMLISPTLFPASMPPVMLIFFLLLRHPTKAIRWVVVSMVVLLSVYWLYVIGYAGDPPVSGVLLSFGFYILIALWGMNIYLLSRQTVTQPKILLTANIGR